MPLSMFRKKSKTMDIYQDYSGIPELNAALNSSGCSENMNIMFFIDRTSSNKNTGYRVFNGQNLHMTRSDMCNPYQLVIRSLGHVLNYNQGTTAPTYAYGSKTAGKCKNHLHFLGMCRNVDEIENVYCQTNDISDQARPTCFRYIVNEAIRVQKATGKYYVVVIITDGCPEAEFMKDDVRAIFEAMDYPLSFVCVGVGDGPFSFLENLDDMKLDSFGLTKSEIKALKRKKNKFDNFQFVPLKDFVADNTVQITSTHIDMAYFHMFMEIPGQYKWIISPDGLNFRPSQALDVAYPAREIIMEHREKGIPPPYGHLEDPPSFSDVVASAPIPIPETKSFV